MTGKRDSKRRQTVSSARVKAQPGEHFEMLYDEDKDKFVLRRVKRKLNWLDVFKQCPVPMDDILPRSRELPKKIKL